jgi:hypothetical protein
MAREIGCHQFVAGGQNGPQGLEVGAFTGEAVASEDRCH